MQPVNTSQNEITPTVAPVPADASPEAVVTHTAPVLPSKTAHLGYLDSLRALAATYVIVFHALFQQDIKRNSLPAPVRLFTSAFYYGHFAVDLFIVLSGFCLMLPVIRSQGVLQGGARQFYFRRARRILPPYYLALLVSLALIALGIGHKTGTIWDNSVPVTPAGLLTHLLLVQDAFGPTLNQINHAFWSISVEWRIYFLFPLLVFGWRRWGGGAVTVAAILAGWALVPLLQPFVLAVDPKTATGILPHYLGLFTLGMLGASIAFTPDARMKAWRENALWPAACVLLALAALALWRRQQAQEQVMLLVLTDTIVGMWAVCLLVWVSRSDDNLLRKLLSWKPLVQIGAFAYSLYLLHAPLLQVLWQYVWQPLRLSPAATFFAQLFVGTPLIIGAAYVFFLACERPFLRRRTVPAPAIP